MLSWTFWSALVLVAWFYILWTRRRFYLLALKVPGPKGYPLLGIAHQLHRRDNILAVFGHYLDKYGHLVLSWLGPIPVLMVSDPQLIQDILTSPHCVNKGLIYRPLEDVAGSGLITLKNPRWSAHRKLLNPAFGHQVLLSFVSIFNNETNILLKVLDTLVDDGEHDLVPLIQKFSLGIATQTTMGRDISVDESIQSNIMLTHYKCVFKAATEMCFSPWLQIQWVRQLAGKEQAYCRAKHEIRAFIKKLTEKKLSEAVKEETSTNTSLQFKDKNIFLNLVTQLLRRGIFSWKNAQDESNIVMFGAFETTANTVFYILMLLAMFPQYQEKAFEEIKTLFPQTGEFEVSYAETQQMVYLELVLYESMRVIAPAPIVARETSKDVRLSNGIVIPKGVQIGINIFHMHRSEKIWGPEAKTFNPDHFLPHNIQDKHPYAYIPFTKGIRNCIGSRYALISIKIILAKLLRNYKFKTSFQFEHLHFVENITMKLKTSPLLELQKRI